MAEYRVIYIRKAECLGARGSFEIVCDSGEGNSSFQPLGRWRKTPHEIAQAILAGDRFYIDTGRRTYLRPVSPKTLFGLWSVCTECGLDLADNWQRFPAYAD